MRNTLVAGSQGVPEALQKCHSMSKQLQQNQTALFLKLDLLTSQLNNFTTQASVVQRQYRSTVLRARSSSLERGGSCLVPDLDSKADDQTLPNQNHPRLVMYN
ncbi:hypothetical protein J6590_022824 [Homalodisca vitripennis]|nr:hypothetical protein J6590_022824 [Homalodisca vitripennis]